MKLTKEKEEVPIAHRKIHQHIYIKHMQNTNINQNTAKERGKNIFKESVLNS